VGQKAANDVGGVVRWDDGAFGGARVDACTAMPLWDGEPVDYDAAVGSLM
jgi:hypothetical protein